jgi:coenzyme F420 hydrogenase subunit beta
LFCGWALSWEPLLALLKKKSDVAKITGIDIPPSKYKTMHVYTDKDAIEVPIDEVNECIRESCHYCFDMTAEFSDISVGSARLPEGWAEAKQWNQIIARTDLGMKLIDLAKKKKVLEFREAHEGALEKVKEASVKKKITAIKNLRAKTKSNDNLIYIDKKDPVFGPLLKEA